MDSPCDKQDHGRLCTELLIFYRAAKDAGIKPILGCEVYVGSGFKI